MLSVYDDAHRAPIEYSDSDESSSDAPPVPQSPGPLDPEHCAVAGRGCSGGAAGSSLTLTVVSKDANNIRIPEGGRRVIVTLEKTGTGEEVVSVDAIDNKDGTYTAAYTAPPRGNYKLKITMDGMPVGGSPFPVFFSPPTIAEVAASLLAAARMGSSPDAVLQMVPDGIDSMHDTIEKCLCVSNIGTNIKADQIKQLFQYCGKVVNVTFISEGKDTALVEFESSLEAGCAIGLNGVMVGERPLSVKLAKILFEGKIDDLAADTLAHAQYDALSSATTQNAQHLVMQLASLRAVAKTALLPAIQAEERKFEGRKAALNAAAEISKKLGYKQPDQFFVPEPLSEDASAQKPLFDKQKLGGPRHYNGRGRFARPRQRSRSISPLPFHRRSRSRRHRSRSRDRSKERHRSHRRRSNSREKSSRRHRRPEEKRKHRSSRQSDEK